MSTQPNPVLSVPPTADPGPYPPAPSNYVLPTEPGPSLSQMRGRLLSRVLMFLQEVMLEYEETLPDWRKTPEAVGLMNTVRSMLAAGEASMTPPPFTDRELEFIEQCLMEYEETHADWRREYFYDPWGVEFDDFRGFYLMMFTQQALGEDQTGTGIAPSNNGSGGTTANDNGILVPPPADR